MSYLCGDGLSDERDPGRRRPAGGAPPSRGLASSEMCGGAHQNPRLTGDGLARPRRSDVSAELFLAGARCAVGAGVEETVRLLPMEAKDHRRTRDLMKKYRMLPMDLADAALVVVAERERIRRIFTVDRRDFSIYRPAKLGKFMIVP